MRRVARVGVAAFLVAATITLVAATVSVGAQGTTLNLLVPSADEDGAMVASGAAGQTWAYWGKLKSTSGAKWGSYRAMCQSSPVANDDRATCTVLLNRGFPRTSTATPDPQPHGGGLVAQGLVTLPPPGDGLFESASKRKVSIVGGSGPYRGSRGSAALQGGSIEIVLCAKSGGACATESENA
jgi:hypothetical protein